MTTAEILETFLKRIRQLEEQNEEYYQKINQLQDQFLKYLKERSQKEDPHKDDYLSLGDIEVY